MRDEIRVLSVCNSVVENDKIIIMKTLIAATFAALMFFAFEMTIPKSSEAGVSCSYDLLGNYVCRDTSNYGNYSTTTTDLLGNDVTTFSSGQKMTCRYDLLGNYVCN